MRPVIALAIVAACGGGGKAVPTHATVSNVPPPRVSRDADPCAGAARVLDETPRLAVHADLDGATTAKARREYLALVTNACHDDEWPLATVDCMRDAASHDDAALCVDGLSMNQRLRLEEARAHWWVDYGEGAGHDPHARP